MSSAPSPQEIARDATWLVQALDPAAGVARLVAMDRESYRAASFLDDRMLQQPLDAQVVPWPTVETAASELTRTDARWIFHIGHVGSTLVSRLLGELDQVLAIREPRILRDLSLIPADVRGRYVRRIAQLMSRAFGDDEAACVKATSFASAIAPELVPAGERALFLHASAANYIAGILAGENSKRELHILAESRADRLAQLGCRPPQPANDAELAAQAWATEMLTLERATDAMPDRAILWADFDAMLDDMAAGMATVAAHLGFDASGEQFGAIVNGPLMRKYSKALEYAYSPKLRRDVLSDASNRFSSEIRAALAMLEQAAEKAPQLARALERSGIGS